jgi:hypothetical protein
MSPLTGLVRVGKHGAATIQFFGIFQGGPSLKNAERFGKE